MNQNNLLYQAVNILDFCAEAEHFNLESLYKKICFSHSKHNLISRLIIYRVLLRESARPKHKRVPRGYLNRPAVWQIIYASLFF